MENIIITHDSNYKCIFSISFSLSKFYFRKKKYRIIIFYANIYIYICYGIYVFILRSFFHINPLFFHLLTPPFQSNMLCQNIYIFVYIKLILITNNQFYIKKTTFLQSNINTRGGIVSKHEY